MKRPGKRRVRWQATVRREGQVSTQTFRTKGDAEKWARKAEAAITDGNELPSLEARKRTVQELLERYKKTEIPKKMDQRNPSRIADFWIDKLGHLKLIRLTPPVIVEVRDELHETLSGSTVNRRLALLSKACTVAIKEWHWMESNPVFKVSKLPEPDGRVRYLSDDERKALLKVTSESDHPYLYAAFMVALTTGARKGEVIGNDRPKDAADYREGLRWRDIDLIEGRAIIHKTKNRDRRMLTLVPMVVDALKGLQSRHDDGLVFVHPGTQQPRHKSFEDAWTAAREKAGIENFTWHDLRHTAGSYLSMSHATERESAEILGHKSLAMVKRYSHLSDEHTRSVVERTAKKYLDSEE